MPVKTLVVLTDYGFVNGGAAQVAVSSVAGLAMSGMRVIFCFGVGPEDVSLRPWQKQVEFHDLQLGDLLGHASPLQSSVLGLWKPQAARRLGEILDRLDPQTTVVHLHSWVQSLTVSALAECQRRGFAIVCTLHDFFSACPNGGLYNYQSQAVCQLAPMSRACLTTHCDSRSYPHKLWRITRQFVQNHIGSMPASIKNYITVSKFSEQILRPFLPADARLYSIGNPIDAHKSPAPDNSLSNEFIFVGRLTPEKGGALLAQAAENIDVKVHFVGKGPQSAAIQITNPSAKLWGWQDRDSVANLMRASRCLVFPSTWYETQGLVVLEAAAHGIPAIVSDGCAARETIIDGVTGLLFRSGDRADLQEKLLAIKTDPALARRLGQQAFDHYWHAPKSLANHVELLKACYGDVLHQQQAA